MHNGDAAYDLVIDFLRAELGRLRASGVPVGEDDYRGLHIPDGEIDRILARNPDPARFVEEQEQLRGRLVELTATATGRLGRLVNLLGLSPFETGCVLVCMVSEGDLSIERLIAFVQDDVSKRRPRVDLVARLFGAPEGGEEEWGEAFHMAAPLRRWRLLQLLEEPGQPATPLRARYLALDEGIASFLQGSTRLSDALHPFATAHTALEVTTDCRHGEALHGIPERLANLPLETLQPSVVALSGGDEQLVRACAATIADAAHLGLVAVDLHGLVERDGMELALTLGMREAGLRESALLLRRTADLPAGDWATLFRALERPGVAPLVILSASPSGPTWRGLTVQVPDLDFDGRREAWRRELPGAALGGEEIDSLAETFRLQTDEIHAAGRIAAGSALWRDPADPRPLPHEAFAGARAASNPVLSSLARRITPRYAWPDIVLPTDTLAQLREVSARVRHAHTVLDVWEFKTKAADRGLVALFAGPSGTGKTMAADIVAGDLELDLYAIDLSGVVSKYIGETEKNLESIFREASNSNALLFFDEADALFGKRSEVKDAHDRYANIETAYLLQRIESYEGPVILATNLKLNLDDAFLRRLDFAIDFPFPEEPERLAIWRGAFPRATPLAADLDLPFLARQFRLTGGNIRNIVLAAAYMAATAGAPVSMEHLMAATRREYQKLGRMVTDTDFGQHLAPRESA